MIGCVSSAGLSTVSFLAVSVVTVCVCVCVCVSSAALEYIKSHPVGEVDEEQFSLYCGVGVVVTPQQIQEQV